MVLLYISAIYSKYAWVIPLKDKKGITITNAFEKIQMNETANQIKYGYIKAAFNRLMKTWLEKNGNAFNA